MRFPCEFIVPLESGNLAPARCPLPRAAASRRVLIMNLRAHGDLLMASSLLHALRAAWSDAHLTFAAERRYRESVDAHPCLDEVLLWETEPWRRLVKRGLTRHFWFLRDRKMRQALEGRRYDIYISLQPEEWAMMARGVKAPCSIGVFDTFLETDQPKVPHRYLKYYTQAFTHGDLPPHRTDQYLLPLRALGLSEPACKRISLGFTHEDVAQVDEWLRARRPNPARPLVVLAPMTTWPSRCWPPERFVELGNVLAARYGCDIVVTGSLTERAVVEGVVAALRAPAFAAAGTFGFRQMGALTSRASLLVSGDTGPMHVAAAVGTPFVALFGPTPVAGRAPLAGRGRTLMHPVPCGPCEQVRCPNVGLDFMRCMRLIQVEEVLEAAGHFMEASPLYETSCS